MSSAEEFSAGGVVYRGDEIVVITPVARAADGTRVLGLPKGHPEAGESLEAAAAREVREEAGVEGELLDRLGEVTYSYERKGRPRRKSVTFFLIRYRAGDPADHDHEIEEARWMDFDAAIGALTYVGEREMVTRARELVRGQPAL
ncbi:NUDIX hydrolase [Conexibacter sp. DBS9H8]|uniref:NUDIX hydrolase n=1 Tax=Conexibacter sp. DBS9H8 TaxID=2937801 RepID=UPI00200F265A|nr:NUDIX domain-containing protein [Conexibacter sp. DBS9H8]